MSQPWVSTSAGRHLSGRRKEHTKPEVALRRALHAAGARFRLHPRLAKGCTPDLVLPRHRLAVFVDGCFFHGCPTHGRKKAWTGPNAALWEEKMRRNAQRDVASTALAAGLGWTVVRIWEHEVSASATTAAAAVLARSCAHEPPGLLAAADGRLGHLGGQDTAVLGSGGPAGKST